MLLYSLALAAARYRIQIHAFCFMSSHFHIILTDPEVELPDFMRDLDLAIAKSMNVHLRRRENFWSPGSYSCTALEDEGAISSEIVYVLMNPVAAGLLRSGDAWPRLRSRPEDVMGRHIVAEKVGPFFSKLSASRETAEFGMVRPPIHRALSDNEFAELISERIRKEEAEIQAQMAREGREFLGRAGILKLPPNTQASSQEPLGKLNPRVAASHRSLRIEAIESLKTFLAEYRHALSEYLERIRTDFGRAREVIFPAGTYLMRVRYGARCHAPP